MADIRTVELGKVARVYRGKPGCMCGCNGRYWYASEFRDACQAKTSVPIYDSEVRDAKVAAIVAELNANAEYLEWDEENQQVFFNAGTVWFVAYFA